MIDVTPLRVSREFRIVFVARIVSIFGLGFASVALPTQVYELTGSSFLVATVHTANAVSVLCGTLVGGVLADRGDRRRLIVVGRASAVVGYGALAANSLVPDDPLLWVIYAVALFTGFFGSFSAVALQAAAPGFVPRDRLPAAGALLALNGELGAVLAPALGGVLIATAGMGGNYTITAVLSLVTTALVWRLPRLEPDGQHRGRPVLEAVADGARFAVRHRVVGPLLLLGFAQLLFAAPYVLINEFTDTVLGGGPAMVGMLYTAPALGALLGSLTSGWTAHVRRNGTVLLAAVVLCGAAVLGLGLSPVFWAAFAFLALLGFGQVAEEILRYALLQSHTPDALRGRVNSLWTAQATIGDSAGALTLGALAPLLGAAVAITAGGAMTVLSVGALALAFPGLRAARVLAEEPREDVPAEPDDTPVATGRPHRERTEHPASLSATTEYEE
ncbi:enterobactin transporter EntS [Thermobifida halotolerans]|uniref:Enterobactin transporter EntS n=2 Tax=Thermobifida halotolerans TaxID=483545 RepID=A0AA97M6A5_9ACTN|nr:enterobactin transporter EntS [Thermobifida halotolerans]